MRLVYISDTNIWIDFRNARILHALFQLPFSFCCTDFVIDELDDVDYAELVALGLEVRSLDESAITALLGLTQARNNSSLADVSCYYLAFTMGYPLLTGDGQLRKQAVKDGLDVHGALWLLDRLVEHAVISQRQAADGLTGMLARGARLPKPECSHRLAVWSDI